MSRARLKTFWSRLPAWGALMVGLGVLVGGNARADQPKPQAPEFTPDLSERSFSRSNEVALRLDGEKIYLSQAGGAFEELHLGDTPEALRLKKLLQDAVTTGEPFSVPVGSMVVASGGGSASGWGWKSKKRAPATSGEGK